jgi:iron(III) transport system ATP-binding protein
MRVRSGRRPVGGGSPEIADGLMSMTSAHVPASLRPDAASVEADDVPPPAEGRGEVGIRVTDLSKTFVSQAGKVIALENLNLEIASSEIVALLGPSGCGKTTTLRCIAGLETPDSGKVEILGRQVVNTAEHVAVAPEKRDLGMVFQSYALWPHMTVFANVAYPLRRRKVDKAQIGDRVQEMLTMVGCGQFADRYPGQLSGGQQQRIALARALVGNPSVILFDEPLSNLDAKLREQMRFELLELHARFRFAAVYVTHDQVEAMTVAHRVAVMRAGRIIQLGAAREVYDRPADRGVADFMGAATFIPGTVRSSPAGEKVLIDTALGEVAALAVDPAALRAGQDVEICARPEQLRIRPVTEELPTGRYHWVSGQLQHSSFQGGQTVRLVTVNGLTLRVDTSSGMSDSEEAGFTSGTVALGLPMDSLYVYS